MKVPEPRKLKSGKWFIQLRLGGQSITVSNFDKTACIREARAIKAEYQIGKRQPVLEKEEEKAPTLTEAIDSYIEARSNTLSPVTIRAYRIIQKNRFKSTMPRHLDEIRPEEWQVIVNTEALVCSPKTLSNAFHFVCSVVHAATGNPVPSVTLPSAAPAERAFLTPDQIKVFVQAVKNTRYAVPALLALSSLRISEIHALRWEDIPEKPDFIRVSGAVVYDENNVYQRKAQNKNRTSTRNVPILIPELAEAIERDRKASGPVLEITQNNLRVAIHKICEKNGLPAVGVHGLRHSFASLAYHLKMPERIAMEIGGWSNSATMQKIYTHIAQSDIQRYKTAMAEFYGMDVAKDQNSKS